jgi:hypothetical protein
MKKAYDVRSVKLGGVAELLQDKTKHLNDMLSSWVGTMTENNLEK